MMKLATLTHEKTTDTETAETETDAIAAGIVETAEATGAEAVTVTTVAETTAVLVQAEAVMLTIDTDAAVHATDTVEVVGTGAAIITVVEDAPVHALRAVIGVRSPAESVRGLPIVNAVLRNAREAAVRRPLPQRLQKTTVTSVLSSCSRSPNVPRPAIFAPSSRPLGLSLKLRLSKIESLVAPKVLDTLSSKTKSPFLKLWS
jgi:hypothetical protein